MFLTIHLTQTDRQTDTHTHRNTQRPLCKYYNDIAHEYTITNCLVHRNSVEQPGQAVTKEQYISNRAKPCFRVVTRLSRMYIVGQFSLAFREEISRAV